MSLAAILESIEQDAAAEAARVVEAARTEGAAIRAAAEADADRRIAAACAAAEPGLRAEAARVVNAARLRLLRGRAKANAERAEAAWQTAGARLAAIADEDGDRWRRALEALTSEALAMVGAGAVVEARAADAAVVDSIVVASGGHLSVVASDAPAGVRVRSADGRVEIDATVRARLAKARHTLTVG